MRLLARALLVVPLSLGVPLARAADDWSAARKEFRLGARGKEWEQRKLAYTKVADFDGAEAAAEVLDALGREDHPIVVFTALKTLSAFQTEGASKVLGETARTGKGVRKTYALLALREQKGPGPKADLLAMLDDAEGPTVAHATLALGFKQAKDAGPKLVTLLGHKDWQVRAAAATALRLLEKSAPADAKSALAAALAAAQGAERGPMVAALAAITGKDFGYDPEAWRRLAAGEADASIPRAPKALPYFFGVPVWGKRVVVLVDRATGSDDPHPYPPDRLKELCEVPGGRGVPWYKLRTKGELIWAHARRAIADLGEGTSFDAVTIGTQFHPVFGKLTPATPGAKETAAKELDDLKPSPGNDVYGALMDAFDAGGKGAAAWASGPDTILYANCGNPWMAPVKDVPVVGSAIGLEGRIRLVPVTTVGVGNHPVPMLREIAERSGGVYVDLQR